MAKMFKDKYRILFRPGNNFGPIRAMFYKYNSIGITYEGSTYARPEGGSVRVMPIELLPYNPPIFNN